MSVTVGRTIAMHAMRPKERNSTVIFCRVLATGLQELNAYRILLQTLFNYDWVNVPLVYTQVPSRALFSRFTRLLSTALCLSVCLSLPVCHKSVFYRNGWTDRAGFCLST